MLIGNHAALFGPRILTEMGNILNGLHNGGCEGVEIGKRFLGEFDACKLKEELDNCGMVLSAYHVMTSLTTILDNPESVHNDFVVAADYLEGFPVKNIMLTPFPIAMQNIADVYDVTKWDSRLREEDNLKKICAFLDAESVYLKGRGVTLNLHNHDWEFAVEDGMLIRAYLLYAPNMNIGLDIGWCGSCGWDPVALFNEYPSRFSYIHARDFKMSDLDKYKSWKEKHDYLFCDLGEGDMPLREILASYREIAGDNAWVTIEYECGEVSYERYCRATEYLKQILGETK